MKVSTISVQLIALLASTGTTNAFTAINVATQKQGHKRNIVLFAKTSTISEVENEELAIQKKKLFGLLRASPVEDAVLADPITKEGVVITTKGTILGDERKASYNLQSPTNSYSGSSDGYIDLLEPVKDNNATSTSNTDMLQSIATGLATSLVPLVPPPIRMVLSNVDLPFLSEYIPMRDLFTSPSVSFAYERGWRQSFAQAGFPGPDKEAAMAMDYFEPSMAKYDDTRVLVDMSCATGLFTRRFAKSGKYNRVLGCDYSSSMLEQARQFIESDIDLRNSLKKTQLDLVRLDVGKIPMKDESVDALHAGAAMHCWPDLPVAASEIHRVLKPGGRYFATTFLSSWFSVMGVNDGQAAVKPSRQTFQFFSGADELKSLMVDAGFPEDKVSVEVLGRACVVIRCEK